MPNAPLTLYGLKNCDTCKKAMTALTASGRQVAFVDIRAEADLPTLVPAALLIANPTLVKRPVIDTGAETIVGWDKAAQQALKA